MHWTDFLTQSERDQLLELEHTRTAISAYRRLIYDRCRKRLARKVNRHA